MYDNPYLNHLQYNYYPDMDQSYISQNAYGLPQTQNYLRNRYPQMDSGMANYYSALNYKLSNIAEQPIDPNAPTPEQIRQKQSAQAATGAVNSVVSAIPVYGQIIGAATALSGTARGFLKKDEYGNVKGKFGQGLDAELTPVHEQVINDIAQKKYGDAALDVVTGGQYQAFKKWFS